MQRSTLAGNSKPAAGSQPVRRCEGFDEPDNQVAYCNPRGWRNAKRAIGVRVDRKGRQLSGGPLGLAMLALDRHCRGQADVRIAAATAIRLYLGISPEARKVAESIMWDLDAEDRYPLPPTVVTDAGDYAVRLSQLQAKGSDYYREPEWAVNDVDRTITVSRRVHGSTHLRAIASAVEQINARAAAEARQGGDHA